MYIIHVIGYHSLLYHSEVQASHKTLTIDKKLELHVLDKLVKAHVVRCLRSCQSEQIH